MGVSMNSRLTIKALLYSLHLKDYWGSLNILFFELKLDTTSHVVKSVDLIYTEYMLFVVSRLAMLRANNLFRL